MKEKNKGEQQPLIYSIMIAKDQSAGRFTIIAETTEGLINAEFKGEPVEFKSITDATNFVRENSFDMVKSGGMWRVMAEDIQTAIIKYKVKGRRVAPETIERGEWII